MDPNTGATQIFEWPSAGTKTRLMESADGANFTDIGLTFNAGIPELSLFVDGTLRLYNAETTGIQSYISNDNGVTWEHEGTTGSPGSDPSLLIRNLNDYLMFIKTLTM